MASTQVGSIHYDLDLDDKSFNSGVDRVEGRLQGLSGAFQNAEKGSKMFAVGLAAVGAAGAAAIGFGVKMAADIETMTQGFVTLLGSTEKANAAIAMIKKDAATTPFELPGLINANQLLTSVTKDADRSEKFLLNIGKALTAMGKGQPELDRIIVNLQQIGAVGHASAIDIKQFAFAGIPIYDMLNEKLKNTSASITDNSKAIGNANGKIQELKDKLAIAVKQQSEFTDKTKESTRMLKANQIQNYQQQIASLTGKVGDLTKSNGKLTESQSNLDDMIKDGKITFELLEEMFNQAGEGSGRFARAFIEQSGTFNQLMSNFKDNIGIAAAEIVKSTGIFDGVKKALGFMVQFIGDNTPRAVEAIKSFITTIAENAPIVIGIIVGGLTPAFVALAASVWAAMAPLIPFIAIGAAVGLAIKLIVDAMGGWEQMMATITPILQFLGQVFNDWILPQLQAIWGQLTKDLIPALASLWQVLEPVLVPILKVLAVILGATLFAAIMVFIAGIRAAIAIITFLVDVVKIAVQGILAPFKWLFDVLVGNSLIPDLINSIVNWFRSLPGRIGSALGNLVDAIASPFRQAFDQVKRLADDVWNKLQKINPFYRQSPSLVDNVIRGIDVIKNQFSSLSDISLPQVSTALAPTLAGSMGGTRELNQNVNINIDKVGGMQDVSAMGRELGFRASLMPEI